MSNDRSDKGPKGHDAIDEIARRLGSIVETVQDAIKTGGATGEGGRDFNIDTPLGPLSGRHSMSVKSALGGSQARRSGPVRRKPAEEPVTSPTPHQPMIDAFDEADAVVVTADIPGLRLEDVFISCEPGYLVLKVGGAAPFTRRIGFPVLTADHSPRVRMANGILEIRVLKELAP